MKIYNSNETISEVLNCVVVVFVRFTIAASLGGRRFQSVVCTNKKDGRREAADVALRTLMAEGQYKVAQGLNQVRLQGQGQRITLSS